MQKHHLLLSVFLGTAFFGLACSGLPGSTPGGGDGAEKGAKADTSKLKVADQKRIRRKGGKAEKSPTGAHRERSKRKDQYTVKLAPGVKGIDLGNGKVKTGNAKLDGAFDGLGLDGTGRVHRNEAKNKGVADTLGLGRTITIRTKKPEKEVLALLEAHPDVEWVEPVVEVESAGAPNDPYWKHQWHLHNLKIDQAWEITQGEGVIVAVVDTGVSAYEDGYYKLLKGRDMVDNDDDAADMNGHGSHVAGTIGQASDNGIGVAGVAPKVSILPVRVLDANGSGSNTWVAEGIIWAVDHGANIINLSLGSAVSSEVVADACAYAYENGVTVLAATGNDGFTDHIGYPAALDSTIAVGSVDLKDVVTFYSNQGREIDIVAPGGDTTADKNGDGQKDGVLQETRLGGQVAYHFLQGTSMATPHAAGVAALVYAKGHKDPDDIRKILRDTADDLGAKGFDTVYGAGVINPLAALAAKTPPRNSDGGGGDLLITRSRVKRQGDARAVIAWTTNQPAMTYVKGENGFERKDDTKTKVHQVSVSGKPGESIKFTFGSQTTKENRVKDTVTVKF